MYVAILWKLNWIWNCNNIFPWFLLHYKLFHSNMGINYWCRCINLLLRVTIGLFQRTCVDSHTTSVKFFSLLHRALHVVVGMLWWVGDNMHVALKGPWTCVCLLLCYQISPWSLVLLYLFFWVWVPLLHICWFVVVMLWIWNFL